MYQLYIIRREVEIYFQMNPGDSKLKSRGAEIVLPRQFIMYFARKLTRLSHRVISKEFNYRHHSSVVNCITALENYIETDKKIRKQRDELRIILEKKLSQNKYNKPANKLRKTVLYKPKTRLMPIRI